MRLCLLINPFAGRGRGETLGRGLDRRLRSEGHAVTTVAGGPGADEARVRAAIERAQATLVVGGDGTVHHVARWAAQSGSGVHHVPVGTENLFARQFGMRPRPRSVSEAVEAGRFASVDLGEINGSPFVLMASVGFDANVVHRLARKRGKRITHLSYVGPILKEALRLRLPRVTLCADGEEFLKERRGVLVIGNSRQYAMRLDPACRASMRDGLLDAVFLPARTRLGLIKWTLLTRLRRHVDHPDALYRRGRRLEISSPDAAPLQVDGEAAPFDAGAETVVFQATPGALRVLLPADAPAEAEDAPRSRLSSGAIAARASA